MNIANIAVISAYVVFIIGWVFNLIAIADATAFSDMLILRAVGIVVAPLGAVLGFI